MSPLDIQELGSIGELVAAVATIGTLAYLAVQIRQNTKTVGSQSRYRALESIYADGAHAFDNHDFLWRFIQKAEPSEEEKSRYRLMLITWFSHHEMVFFEIQDGTLPKEFEGGLRYRLFTVFEEGDVVKDLWDVQIRHYFTPQFQAYVNNQLASGLEAAFPATVLRPAADG